MIKINYERNNLIDKNTSAQYNFNEFIKIEYSANIISWSLYDDYKKQHDLWWTN